MKIRTHKKRGDIRQNQAYLETESRQQIFHTRPFVVQQKREEPKIKMDLKKELERAEQYGHNLIKTRQVRPIQCLMSPDQLKQGIGTLAENSVNREIIDKIESLLAIYDAQIKASAGQKPAGETREQRQVDADNRLEILDEIEHKIYEWFKTTKKDRKENGRYKYFYDQIKDTLKNLLDQVQAEHREVIDVVHNNDLNLWTKSETVPEKARDQKVWNQVRHGQGRIRVTNQADESGGFPKQEVSGFDKTVRAMHARLLSRPKGRGLLEKIEQSQKINPVVTVKPTNPKHDEQMADMGVNPQEVAGLAIPENDNQARAKPGRVYGTNPSDGTASTLPLYPGAKDSGPETQEPGESLLSPAHIVYGHELIHALHNMEGKNMKNIDSKEYSDQKKDKYKWTNKEEHETMDGVGEYTENALREEHNLEKATSHREKY